MYGYIYKVTDKSNGKIYIGRHRAKVFEGYKYTGSGLIISNIKQRLLEAGISIEERLDIEMIDTAESSEELNQKEIYWISKLHSRDADIGYNICKGGEAGPGGPLFQGHQHSEETKTKMSQTRRGVLNSNYGNHWNQSLELKNLHGTLSSGENNGMYGKKQSDEQKQKDRLAHIGKIAISNIKQDKVMMIYEEELPKYLSEGWIKGNIHARLYKK